MKKYKYIYGPVPSWRLGRSLGVDPVYTGKGKICSFDCIYCQVGKTRILRNKREIFVPAEKIIEEIAKLPRVKIDYITFSGAGEPALARNLEEITRQIRELRKEKIAILTNSSTMPDKAGRGAMAGLDFVIAKLDAHSEELFKKINKPAKGLTLAGVIKGIKKFRKNFKGLFGIQIMFVRDNKEYAGEIARLAKSLRPDIVFINTPLRPCRVKPLSRNEIKEIKKQFKGMKVASVYEARKIKTKPIETGSVLKRRGKI